MHFPESATRPGRSVAYRVAVTVLLASLSGVANADALSFQEALALALRETPVLRANTAQVDAATQAAIPAGALPDPKLALGVDNLPIDGPDRYSLSRDFMTMRRIGVMQEFPNRAKRKARVAAAQGRVAVAEAQTRVTRLTVLREVAVAWIARGSIERQLTRSDALLAENRLFEAAVRAQLAAGKAAASEVVAPRQEAALIEERQDVLRAQREQALAQLRRWIGPAAQAPLTGVVPDWPIERDGLLRRLRQHPELAAFDPKARVLEAERAEAQAAKKPDWALELAYQQRGPQFGDMVSLQVSFDLPLFAGSRQNPQIAAKLAERTALVAEREAMLHEHAAALEADFAEYQRLVNAVQRQREVLLPLAEERVTLALAGWRGGKGSLTELIAARRERIDAELKAIALEGERQQMAARLHYAYGDIAGEQG
ncbi:MAG: TolC family protein [Candidatus Tectomicrobia bacterium]|nr:TolC family protein [Candidatus Tectomicrobia bacterium]